MREFRVSLPPVISACFLTLVLLVDTSTLCGQQRWSSSELLRITDDRFFNVTAGELTDIGEIWIANDGSHQVLQFSRDGGPLQALGGEGQGPGELQSVSNVSVAGDSIFVSDLRLGRMTTFARDGAVLEVQGLEGRWWLGAEFIDRLADGSVVLLRHEAPPDEMIGHVEFDAVLYRAARVGDEPELIDRFPGRELFYGREGDVVRSKRIPFARNGLAVSSGTVVAYGATDEPTIRRFAPTEQLDPVVLAAEPKAATGELIRREQRRLLGLAPDEQLPQAVRARMAEVPEPDILPLYDALAVGDDGSVWVVPPPSISEGLVSVTILRPDGSTAEVTFPRELEILDITSDSVLAVERDALDVESIVVYRLVAESATP